MYLDHKNHSSMMKIELTAPSPKRKYCIALSLTLKDS